MAEALKTQNKLIKKKRIEGLRAKRKVDNKARKAQEKRKIVNVSLLFHFYTTAELTHGAALLLNFGKS